MASKRRKARKASGKFLIAIIAVLLIVAVAFCILYFAFPDTYLKIAEFFNGGAGSGGDLASGDGDLIISFIDVGQGDCIFIEFPDDKEMIIDCANYNNSSDFKTETLGYLSERIDDGQIDYLMLTHCDSDHVFFMDDIIEAYQVDNIFMPNVLASHEKVGQADIPREKIDLFTDPDEISTGAYADFFIAALSEPDCEISLNVDPDENTNSVVIEDETYKLTFYCPTREYYENSSLSNAEKKNAISPIGILEYNGFKVVLTGDSNEINEPQFIDRIGGKLDCDVLKVGHHGSETSSTAEFLDAITCEYAIISCNASGNNFKHPRQATLDRFAERTMFVYRTDTNGTIVLTINKTLTFVTEKPVDLSANLIGADRVA